MLLLKEKEKNNQHTTLPNNIQSELEETVLTIAIKTSKRQMKKFKKKRT